MSRVIFKLLILPSLLIIGNSACSNNFQSLDENLLGEYSSVTESQCNVILVLSENKKGVLNQKCRLEDGSHVDEVKTENISWDFKNDMVRVFFNAEVVEFDVIKNMSCEDFGDNGMTKNGLIARTYVNNFMEGFGSKLWRAPINCK